MAYYFSQKQIFSVKTIKKIYSKQCGELILKFRGDKNNNRPLIPATAHFFFHCRRILSLPSLLSQAVFLKKMRS